VGLGEDGEDDENRRQFPVKERTFLTVLLQDVIPVEHLFAGTRTVLGILRG